MIKLFRNIRQTLLNEGKTSKYLRYAVGEIVLVVIGILIALQINTWNLERINKNLETKYYERLLEDLKEEEASSQSIIDYIEQVSMHSKKAILFFDNQHDQNKNSSQNLIDLYQASQILDNRPIMSTYQELISSGQLNIFQNDSIKTSIISYYNLDWSESLVFRFPEKYRYNLRSKMPYEIQEKIRTNCGDVYQKIRRSTTIILPKNCAIDIPIEISKPALASLLSDTKLKEDLLYLIGNQESQLAYLKIVRIQLQGLIAQIESLTHD